MHRLLDGSLRGRHAVSFAVNCGMPRTGRRNSSATSQAKPLLEEKAERLPRGRTADYVHRGIKERWLCHFVRCLNWLEQRPTSRDIALRARVTTGISRGAMTV